MTSLSKKLLTAGMIGLTAISGCSDNKKREFLGLDGIASEIQVDAESNQVSVVIKVPTKDYAGRRYLLGAESEVGYIPLDTLRVHISHKIDRPVAEAYPIAVGDEVHFALSKGFEGEDAPYTIHPSQIKGEIISWRKRK